MNRKKFQNRKMAEVRHWAKRMPRKETEGTVVLPRSFLMLFPVSLNVLFFFFSFEILNKLVTFQIFKSCRSFVNDRCVTV